MASIHGHNDVVRPRQQWRAQHGVNGAASVAHAHKCCQLVEKCANNLNSYFCHMCNADCNGALSCAQKQTSINMICAIYFLSFTFHYAAIKYMKCSHAPQQAQMSNGFSLAPELDFRHEHDHVIYLKRATRWQQRQLVKARKANALSSSSTATTTAT